MTRGWTADVLDSARWTVGSISISVPDVTNQYRKLFGEENAVTVEANAGFRLTGPAAIIFFISRYRLRRSSELHQSSDSER